MKIKNLLTTLALAATFLFMGNVGLGQEAVIYSTGFESSEGFTASTTYNNASVAYTGPAGQQWGTSFGTPSTTGPISLLQSMQMRYYTATPTSYGYTFTNFDLANVTKVTFKAKNNASTATVTVSYSTDGGSNYVGAQAFTLSTTAASFEYVISATGEYANVRLKFTLSGTTVAERLIIDDISVYGKVTDTNAPIATFDPTNAESNVAIDKNVTITFDEAIRNIDDTEITDANLASLLTLKTDNSSGTDVPFSATIDGAKKIITINPTSDLTNNQVYYVAIAPVEDASDNASATLSATFTTIALNAPILTLTAPNTGGKFYAGAQATITWTSTNIDAAETINIEVAPNGVDYQPLATSTNDGTENITIPAAAIYATTYKIKVSYSTASDESDAAFTVIPVVANIAAFKALTAGTVAKISGEVIVNFIRTANRNQKYVQDATGGLLIDDNAAVITTTHNLYDGITGLEGTLVMFGTYTYELVPTVNTAASTSTGNTITPAVITLAQLKADHMQHQSMLVKVQNVAITQANGTAAFVAASDYTMQQGTETAVLRQAWKAGETDLIGTVIPQGALDIVGIVAQYTTGGTTTAQLSPRTVADITDKAPIATFSPASGATNVVTSIVPTISFTETIRNIDNTEITDANVGSLVTLKEKASGTTVTSTITIDATKKLITITPSVSLTNNLEYEISLAAIEDINDKATTPTTSTFTTVDAATPTLTLTAPNGGGKYYAGQTVTITWTSTNMDAENIKVEAYIYSTSTSTWSWTEVIPSTANDGTEDFTIPTDAAYGISYKMRVTGLTSSTTDESDAAFTVIATTDNLLALRALPTNSIVKYTGKATVTFPTTYRNQKYIQDATAAILIDDPTTAPGYITDSYAIGDGISNIEGKVSVYGNLIQLVPEATTGEKVTGNPTITPELRTIASITAADQCKLVKIENMSLSATGNFVARTNYDVVGQANTAFIFRSAPTGANYIGTAIPVHPFDLICVVGQYNAVMQVTPRSLADFDVHVPVYTVTFTVTRNSAAIEGASIAINSQTLTTNASGIATIDLPSGTYNYNVTKDGYNTNSGSVVVASAAKAVDVVMTLTSVETNSISKLNAYPNPFSNEIRFDGAEIARVTITSIIGQVVMDKVVAGENLVETQSLSKGIYLVKFTNVKGESVLRKLVKE